MTFEPPPCTWFFIRKIQKLAQADAALETATARAREAGAALASANRRLPAAEHAVQRSRGEVAVAQVRRPRRPGRLPGPRRARRRPGPLRRAGAKRRRGAQELNAFVRASYEGGPALATSAMLGATSPDELIAGLNYLDNLAGSQQRAVDAVTRTRLDAAEQRATVAEPKRLADEADARAKAALAAPGPPRTRRAPRGAPRPARRATPGRPGRRPAGEGGSAAQYTALLAESRSIAAALREAARRARGSRGHRGRPCATRGNGDLGQPVDGWKSSDYGMPIRPLLQDLAAPRGHRLRGPGRGGDLRGRDRDRSAGRLERWLRPVHVHPPRPARRPRPVDLLRPPVAHPRRGRRAGPPRRHHRTGRHHRRVHRQPPALRSPPRRRTNKPSSWL